MTRVKLIHNAGAGDENHSEKKIISMIESKGFTCDYTPVKSSDWDISPETDFIVVAGGDGTVKKTAKKLLNRPLIDKSFPIAILPLGTANNLFRSLKIGDDIGLIIESWMRPNVQKFDIGRVYGLEKHHFFLEALGYGVFPHLINKMKKVDQKLSDDPENRIQTALETLLEAIHAYNTHFSHIVIDGKDYSGNYLMVEIMNIPSIGPNLLLAPEADSEDGFFDIKLIEESQRDLLASYVESKLNGKEIPLGVSPVKGNQIYIKWQGTDGHIDDKTIHNKEHHELKINNHTGVLEFLR